MSRLYCCRPLKREESAQQEQQQGTGHAAYLIHRRFQRGGQSPVHSQKQQTHRGAYDQRVGEDHPQEPGGAQLFAPEHRQGDDGQHVEQGHDHRGQHRHGTHVRAGHQRLGQRQADDRQIAAVHALDLHALLFGILFRGQHQRHGQAVHRQHRRHREQQQPRLHRVGQGGVIQIAEQHDRHEIAEGQLVQGRHGVDADGAQTFGAVAQRHDEKQGATALKQTCRLVSMGREPPAGKIYGHCTPRRRILQLPTGAGCGMLCDNIL